MIALILALISLVISVAALRTCAQTQRTLIRTYRTISSTWRTLHREDKAAESDATLRSLERWHRVLRVLALEWLVPPRREAS